MMEQKIKAASPAFDACDKFDELGGDLEAFAELVILASTADQLDAPERRAIRAIGDQLLAFGKRAHGLADRFLEQHRATKIEMP